MARMHYITVRLAHLALVARVQIDSVYFTQLCLCVGVWYVGAERIENIMFASNCDQEALARGYKPGACGVRSMNHHVVWYRWRTLQVMFD